MGTTSSAFDKDSGEVNRPPTLAPQGSSERALGALGALPSSSPRRLTLINTARDGNLVQLSRVPWLTTLTFCDGISLAQIGGCSATYFHRTRSHESSGIWRYLLRRDFASAAEPSDHRAASVAALMRAQVLPALRADDCSRVCEHCTVVQTNNPPPDIAARVLAAVEAQGDASGSVTTNVRLWMWLNNTTDGSLAADRWQCEVCSHPLETLAQTRARGKLALIGVQDPGDGAIALHDPAGLGGRAVARNDNGGHDETGILDIAWLAPTVLKRLRSDGKTLRVGSEDPMNGDGVRRYSRGFGLRSSSARRARGVLLRPHRADDDTDCDGGAAAVADDAGGGAAADAAVNAAYSDSAAVASADVQPFYELYYQLSELYTRGEIARRVAKQDDAKNKAWYRWRFRIASWLTLCGMFPAFCVWWILIVAPVVWVHFPRQHHYFATTLALSAVVGNATEQNMTCAAATRSPLQRARLPIKMWRLSADVEIPLWMIAAPFAAAILFYVLGVIGACIYPCFANYVRRTRGLDSEGETLQNVTPEEALFVVDKAFPDSLLQKMKDASSAVEEDDAHDDGKDVGDKESARRRLPPLPFRRLRDKDVLDEFIVNHREVFIGFPHKLVLECIVVGWSRFLAWARFSQCCCGCPVLFWKPSVRVRFGYPPAELLRIIAARTLRCGCSSGPCCDFPVYTAMTLEALRLECARRKIAPPFPDGSKKECESLRARLRDFDNEMDRSPIECINACLRKDTWFRDARNRVIRSSRTYNHGTLDYMYWPIQSDAYWSEKSEAYWTVFNTSAAPSEARCGCWSRKPHGEPRKPGCFRIPCLGGGYVLSEDEQVLSTILYVIVLPLLAGELLCTKALVCAGFSDSEIPAWTRPLAALSNDVVFGTPSEVSWGHVVAVIAILPMLIGLSFIAIRIDRDLVSDQIPSTPARARAMYIGAQNRKRSYEVIGRRSGAMAVRTGLILAIYWILAPSHRPEIPRWVGDPFRTFEVVNYNNTVLLPQDIGIELNVTAAIAVSLNTRTTFSSCMRWSNTNWIAFVALICCISLYFPVWLAYRCGLSLRLARRAYRYVCVMCGFALTLGVLWEVYSCGWLLLHGAWALVYGFLSLLFWLSKWLFATFISICDPRPPLKIVIILTLIAWASQKFANRRHTSWKGTAWALFSGWCLRLALIVGNTHFLVFGVLPSWVLKFVSGMWAGVVTIWLGGALIAGVIFWPNTWLDTPMFRNLKHFANRVARCLPEVPVAVLLSMVVVAAAVAEATAFFMTRGKSAGDRAEWLSWALRGEPLWMMGVSVYFIPIYFFLRTTGTQFVFLSIRFTMLTTTALVMARDALRYESVTIQEWILLLCAMPLQILAGALINGFWWKCENMLGLGSTHTAHFMSVMSGSMFKKCVYFLCLSYHIHTYILP